MYVCMYLWGRGVKHRFINISSIRLPAYVTNPNWHQWVKLINYCEHVVKTCFCMYRSIVTV